MSFGVDISKLHVWYCVHHVKFIVEMNLTDSGNQDVKWNWLEGDTVCQDYFIVAWFSSYNFDRGPMG